MARPKVRIVTQKREAFAQLLTSGLGRGVAARRLGLTMRIVRARMDDDTEFRDAVLDAAVRLADRDGLAALSMRSLARHLGIEAMSLYHHVANKEALLDGMVDVVFGEIHLPRVGADWAGELRLRHVSAREVLTRT